MTRKTVTILMMVAFIASMGLTSCEEEENQTLKVSFGQTELSIQETNTSTLEVPVRLNVKASRDLEIPFQVSGSAEPGVHYEAIEDKTVMIEKGEDSTVILVDPINETKIQGDKTMQLKLGAGDGYILQETNTAEVTIIDNDETLSDAPVVKFTSDSTMTNAYLRDTIEMKVGMSKALDNQVMIPVKFDGSTAEQGKHYEVVGLNDNNELKLPAGDVSASFGIAVQYTGKMNIEKMVEVSFAEPSVTSYKLGDSDIHRAVEIIDPKVNNVWFLKGRSWDGGNQKIVFEKNAIGEMAFDGNCIPKQKLAEGVHEPWVLRKEADDTYAPSFPGHTVKQHPDDPNAWSGNWTYTFIMRSCPNSEDQRYPYYYNYRCNAYDLTDEALMTKDYLVGYMNNGIRVDKYLRFAAMNKEGTKGKVIIPKQTLTGYAAKEGYDWEGESEVGEQWGMQENWKIDSHQTEGKIEESDHVKEVKIDVQGEGTFNTETKEIKFTVHFSSEDSNLKKEQATFKIYPTSDDVPN